MALAAVKTWNPGDTLTAADLNALNTNILNNPISLISPTTGAINFQTSVAHSNLQVSALTASSGFAGSVLVGSTAVTPVPVWSTGATAGGVFVATTGAVPTWLAGGSSGQVLLAATSGVPVWSTSINWISTTRELQANRFGVRAYGTALTTNHIILSTEWGSTATITFIQGTDQAYRFAIQVGSTTQANPRITTTFADGVWQSTPTPFAFMSGNNSTGNTVPQIVSLFSNNTSGQVWQPLFLPTTGATYTFTMFNMG